MNTSSKQTRRRFLQNTALAASAPFILPSSVWGAEANAQPNQRINIGFIGVGKQAQGHIGYFTRRPDVQVVAVCDVDTTRREHAKQVVNAHYAKKEGKDVYKGCADYSDFREIIARKDIDAVVVVTPDHWHALNTIPALAAGKDVFCEKPLSLTIHEAKEMTRATRQYDRVFQTGSMQRSSREFHTACELVRNGVIGKITHVDVSVGPSSKWCDLPEEPMEKGLEWGLWLGPAPLRPYNSILSPRGVHNHFPSWRNYREYSGGMMTDWGAHHFDIAQWGLGMDGSGPVEVIPPADDKAMYGVKYIYANGVELNHVQNGFGVTFFGTNGKINVNRGRFELWLDEEMKASNPGEGVEIAKTLLNDQSIRLYESRDHQGDFLNCMRTRKRPICDVAIGASSVTVCHLGNLAYWNRTKLKWDPDKGEFVGESGSNEWRDYQRRAPWRLPA